MVGWTDTAALIGTIITAGAGGGGGGGWGGGGGGGGVVVSASLAPATGGSRPSFVNYASGFGGNGYGGGGGGGGDQSGGTGAAGIVIIRYLI